MTDATQAPIRIILAARGSPLSRAQARLVATALRRAARKAKLPSPRISFRFLASHGDKDFARLTLTECEISTHD